MNEKKNNLILPVAGGVLLGLAYPPLPTGFIAWFALIPFIHCLKDADFGESVRRGSIFALIHSAVALYFINFNSGAPLPVAISSYLGILLILTLLGPLFAIPYRLLRQKFGDYALVAVPFLWTSIEYLRSLGEIAFPWNILPLTQAEYLAPSQLVSITGVWGLSFWVAGINVLIYITVTKKRKWGIPTIIWIIIPFLYGMFVLRSQTTVDRSLNIYIVQGNVDPASKWANGLNYNIDLYRGLTEKIDDADLIVWPETAIPARLNREIRAERFVRNFTEAINTPIFTGALAIDVEPDGKILRFNSAFLIKPNEWEIERYDKIKLVPFGERVPFQSIFPKLGNLNFGQAEFTPGLEYKLFTVTDSLKFGAMICFESVLPQTARKFVVDGADFLINITNDGWYGKTSEPMQQALLTRFRAIENRRSLVRAANTGISYICDAQGRFLTISELEVEAVLEAQVPIISIVSFYSKYGDIFAKSVLLISLGIIILAVFIPKFFSQRMSVE